MLTLSEYILYRNLLFSYYSGCSHAFLLFCVLCCITSSDVCFSITLPACSDSLQVIFKHQILLSLIISRLPWRDCKCVVKVTLFGTLNFPLMLVILTTISEKN